MKASTAKEILERRIEGDRQRYLRLKENRYGKGYRQTTVWLTADDLAVLDGLKDRMGLGNRSDALAVLIREQAQRGDRPT